MILRHTNNINIKSKELFEKLMLYLTLSPTTVISSRCITLPIKRLSAISNFSPITGIGLEILFWIFAVSLFDENFFPIELF